MDIVILILTIIGIIAAVVFGFLQVIVPFVKREVSFSKRFPFVASLEAVERSSYHGSLGIAYACLGNKENAIR